MANDKRLIDANALDNQLSKLMIRFHTMGRDKVVEDYNFVRTVLETAPTVDAVEVVHGRWIEKVDMVESYLADCTEVFYECSVCECANIGESPYCPNCGAKMDGEGNG